MSPKKNYIKEQLKKFLPKEGVDQVVDLIVRHKVRFKISQPRKTKLGDYRPPPHKEGHHRISVNGNLNPYAFYLTTIHEFAHLETYLHHGRKVAPHGVEWKILFSEMLENARATAWFPADIKSPLNRYISNPKASSCGDHDLYQALRKYDKNNTLPLLKDLEKGSCFKLQGKCFEKGETLRKRVKCKEIDSGKLYLVNSIAEVTLID